MNVQIHFNLVFCYLNSYDTTNLRWNKILNLIYKREMINSTKSFWRSLVRMNRSRWLVIDKFMFIIISLPPKIVMFFCFNYTSNSYRSFSSQIVELFIKVSLSCIYDWRLVLLKLNCDCRLELHLESLRILFKVRYQ